MKYVLTLWLFSITAYSYGQFKVGLVAGLNLNDVYSKVNSDNIYPSPTKIKKGFHIGPLLSYQLNKRMSLQSGVLLSSKGFQVDVEKRYEKDSYKGLKTSGYDRTRLNYLEIPLALSYTLWKQMSIRGGGYCAFGIGGKSLVNYTASGDHVEYNEQYKPAYDQIEVKREGGQGQGVVLIFPSDPSRFRGLDYGVQAGLAYQVGNLILAATYLYGLNNTNPRYTNFPSDYFIHKHRNAYFSVGYFFGRARN